MFQFLLNATQENHIQEFSPTGPDFVKKFKKKFYVDDLNTSVYSVDEGINLCNKLKISFQKAKFNLIKWLSYNATWIFVIAQHKLSCKCWIGEECCK